MKAAFDISVKVPFSVWSDFFQWLLVDPTDGVINFARLERHCEEIRRVAALLRKNCDHAERWSNCHLILNQSAPVNVARYVAYAGFATFDSKAHARMTATEATRQALLCAVNLAGEDDRSEADGAETRAAYAQDAETASAASELARIHWDRADQARKAASRRQREKFRELLLATPPDDDLD